MPHRPMSQYETALSKLRHALDSGIYSQGQRLPPERDLAASIGVGRRTLRLALDLLEAEGRLWRHVGQGTFAGPRPPRKVGDIAPLTERTNPAEIMEVRLQIEPPLARLAALRATVQDLADIRHYVEKCDASTNAEAYEIWDSAVHRAIARAAHNTLYLGLFDALNTVRSQTAWGQLREAVLSDRRRTRYAGQHRTIYGSLQARNPEAAEAQMRSHLEAVQHAVMSYCGSRSHQAAE